LRIRSVLFLLLVLALCPYFIDLGGSSIWDANEAFYVETPREMIERGDYISPTFNYEPRLNKPVLSYWIVAGFYRVLGVSVGVQRLAIACGAVAIIGTAFLLAWAGFSAPLPTPNARHLILGSRMYTVRSRTYGPRRPRVRRAVAPRVPGCVWKRRCGELWGLRLHRDC